MTLPSSSPPAAHRRWRNVLLGGGSAAGARAVASLCSLLTVPLALRVLGADGFGLWIVLQSAAALCSVLDFGLAYRLQNAVSHAAASEQLDKASDGARTVLWLSFAFSLLGYTATLLLGPETSLRLFGFETPTPGTTDAIAAPPLALLAILVWAALPVSVGAKIAAGLQRFWLVGAAQALISVLTLLAAGAAVALKVSPATLLLAALVIPVAVNGALTVAMLRQLPRGSQSWRPPSCSVTASWFRASLAYFLPQLAGTLRFSGPPFLLAAVLGAAAVTPYNLVQRLLVLLAQPQSWLLEPLWPAYADAAARSDHAWIRKTLRFSLVVTLGATVLPLLTTPLWAGRFIEWWTAYESTAIPTALIVWTMLWQIGLAATHVFNYCLNGLGRMKWQAIYTPVCVGLGLLGIALLAPHCGLACAIAPAAVATVVLNLPCVVLDLHAAMRPWSRHIANSTSPA